MTPTPPVAPKRPHVLTEHGNERVDDWFWIRERDNPEVLAHLEAENAYAAKVLAPFDALCEQMFQEIKGRIEETDESAPIPYGPWEYARRTVEGLQYAMHVRRPRDDRTAEATVILDENVLAEGAEYFALGAFELSPDHNLLAYSVDVTGAERYTMRVRDLRSGTDLPDSIDDATMSVAWTDDGSSFFYAHLDELNRAFEVRRHVLGTDTADDVLVREEVEDERFYLDVGRTRSGRFVLIDATSKQSTEVFFIPLDAPDAAPRSIGGREEGHEYSVEHHWSEERGDRFLILTNQSGKARNFELVSAPCVDPARQYWTPIVPHRDDVKLDFVVAFAEHIVLAERTNGLERLRVMRTEDGDLHVIEVPDPVYSIWIGPNEEYDTRTLRYGYTSLVAPMSDFDYDMEARKTALVKQQPVLGGYDLQQYSSKRLWATAPDGVEVPISLVHRRDTPLDGTAPALLYGYGSYESSVDPTFRISRLSLIDRGFVYAIAHVRGGGEMGRVWYEQGRLEHKTNTFTDFIAAADHLIAENVVAPDRLAARGASAGGLLMGAVVNLRPELFCTVVAEVPFVDIVTTMLDVSLPLTVTEWDEWGDPREPDAYARMLSYAPYDNVHDAPYPAMFVSTGLSDPNVQYWEPVKWVQKLREHSTSGRPIILKTELGAGHHGPSGRYHAWRDEALVLSFVSSMLGVTD